MPIEAGTMFRKFSIVGIMAVSAAIAACGGGSTEPNPTSTPMQQPAPTATAVAQPTNTPVAPMATSVVVPTQAPGGGDLVAEGKVLFEQTASGTGCALCHGLDAQGMASVGSPNIIGKASGDIWNALDTRAQMSFMVLTDDEVNAIAAYLAFLAE